MSSSMASQDSDSKNTSFYSRKEKSLGVLCTNFLKLYDRDGVECIGLDNAASQLGVERRRIYDIVNILESVGILAKKAKNQYTWKGFRAIPQALEELKEEALKENLNYSSCYKSGNVSNDNQSGGSSSSNADGHSKENRKEKSLGLLTQNFIKLFLTSKADLITLDSAAATLLGDQHDPMAMRTKVRRLYDIANVFSSMDLIEKARHPENGKPGFRWLGLQGHAKIKSNTTLGLINVTTKRAFGTEITNTYTKRSRVDHLFDCNSNEKVTVAMHRNNDLCREECHKNLMKQQPQHSSKDFVFGPFSPASVPNAGLAANKKMSKDHDWENLASTYRLSIVIQLYLTFSSTTWKHGSHGMVRLKKRNTHNLYPDHYQF